MDRRLDDPRLAPLVPIRLVGFGQPGPEIVVDVFEQVDPERVNVLGADRLDPHEARVGEDAAQDDVAAQAPLLHGQPREAHAGAEADPGLDRFRLDVGADRERRGLERPVASTTAGGFPRRWSSTVYVVHE